MDIKSLLMKRSLHQGIAPASAKTVRQSLKTHSRAPLLGVLGLLGLGIAQAQAGTLTDLGYPNGLTLNGQGASQTVYFPLPAGANGAVLNLKFTNSGALDSHSSVTISANGIPLTTIKDSDLAGVVPLMIPPRFTTGQFLQLSFTAAQTVDNEDHCYDNDNPAVWTQIDPATTLTANAIGPQGVGAVWRGFGAPLTIALPATPVAGDIETALILSTALVERGIAPFFGNDPATAAIIINPAATGLTLTPLDATHEQITVPNAAAARALVAADSALRDLPSSGATAVQTPNAASGGDDDIVTFGALGLPPAQINVTHDSTLHLPIPFAQLPAEKHAKTLVLYGAGAALPPNETEVITLEIGGDVIWSRAFQGAPVLNGQRIDLPDRLVASGAQMNLHFVRLGSEQFCEHFAPLPFTLQDNTAIEMSPTSAAPRRFAAFTVAGNGPAPILTDLPMASLAPSLPLLAELLGSAGANPLAVTVGDLSKAPTAPFILVSHTAGNIVSTAPIPTPAGKVTLALPDQNTVVTLPEANNTSILQLVSAGSDTSRIPGLWLSPGPAPSLAQAALPGDGNVAFYDGSAAPATYATDLHDAVFVAPPKGIVSVLLNNWNTELFGAFWLLVMVLAVVIFVRRRKRTK